MNRLKFTKITLCMNVITKLNNKNEKKNKNFKNDIHCSTRALCQMNIDIRISIFKIIRFSIFVT